MTEVNKHQKPKKKPVFLSHLSILLYGTAALIYQIVWQRIFSAYYGVSFGSTSIVLASYMFGLGAGSLLGAYFSKKGVSGKRGFILAQLFLSVFVLVTLSFLPSLGALISSSTPLYGGVFIFLFLSIPTILIGAAFPFGVSAIKESSFQNSISRFYFLNTIGSGFGILLSSYWILSYMDMNFGLISASSINVISALLALRYLPRQTGIRSNSVYKQKASHSVSILLLVTLSGFISLGLEMVYIRFLSVILKGSPYVFSTVLFVFISALGIGGYYTLRSSRLRSDRNTYFLLQGLIGIYVIFSITGFYYLNKWGVITAFTQNSFQYLLHPPLYLKWSNIWYAIDLFLWPIIFVFPPAFLMGASFPLITTLFHEKGVSRGYSSGIVYSFSTLGNILGALITGFVLLNVFGTSITFLILGIGAVLFLIPLLLRKRSLRMTFLWVAFLIMVFIIFPNKTQLYKSIHKGSLSGMATILISESTEGVVVTGSNGEKVKNVLNGLGHGFRPGVEFQLEAAYGLSSTPVPENVLIIGMGTGTFVEVAVFCDDTKKIDVVELNPSLLENLRNTKSTEFLFDQNKINYIVGDGRRFLYENTKKYDLIMMDPLRTTTAYSNNLYSLEFFQLLRTALSDNGVLLFWSDEQYIVPATIDHVFEHIRFFTTPQLGFFGVASDIAIDFDEERFNSLASIFTEIGHMRTAIRSIPVLIVKDPGLLNRDLAPKCEYYTGYTHRITRLHRRLGLKK